MSAQILEREAAAPRAHAELPDIIIDLFAGGGGTSTGIEGAAGRSPDIAVNHDAEALALHAVNHPNTLHLCDDIRQIDVVALLSRPEFKGRRVGLLWASPDCKDHSKAKGGVPKDKNIRGLAWEVLRWVAAIRRATGRPPRAVALENVEEFADWGPIHRYGRKAGRVMKGRRKETYRLWKANLASLGGRIEERELIAANFGAPTTRKRLYVVIQFDGDPIVWPAATHGPRHKKGKQVELFDADHGLKPYRAAADIIDWGLKVPSIFGRKKPLAPKTERRIARGIDRFVIRAQRPFIIPVTHSTGGDRAYDSADPLKTMTTAKGGDFQLVSPTFLPVTHAGDDRVYGPEDQLPTVTAAHRGELALGQTVLAGASVGVGGRAGQSPPRGLDDPVNTITAKGDRAIASAYLVPRYGEREGQDPHVISVEGPAPTVVPDGNGGSLANVFMQKMSENGVGYRTDDPLHTAMAGAPRHYEVAAYLGRQFGSTVSGRDLAEPHPAVMTDGGGAKSQVVTAHLGRMANGSVGGEAEEPTKTVTGTSKDALITPIITKYHNESAGSDIAAPMPTVTANSFIKRPGGAAPLGLVAPVIDKYYATGVAQEADRPLDVVTAKARFSVTSAYIEQANTGVVGRTAESPLSTITASGAQQRLIGADLEPYDEALAAIGAPAGSKRRDVLAFLWQHFGMPTEAEWADPTDTLQGRLRFGLVILDGQVWQIVDIGMRMLTPRELYGAQGFPPDYQIELTLANGKPLTKTAQTRMAGNSVSPPVARALIAANCPWLRAETRVAA